jgi:hypothetical protein
MNELFQWRVKAEILVQIEFDKLRIKVRLCLKSISLSHFIPA